MDWPDAAVKGEQEMGSADRAARSSISSLPLWSAVLLKPYRHSGSRAKIGFGPPKSDENKGLLGFVS